jgi:hypothetical protein
MASLMDALNRQIVDSENRQMVGGQQAARRLLAARKGKQVGSDTGPRRTSLAEAMQAQEGQAQLGQLEQQAALSAAGQREQQAGIEQQAAMEAQELANREDLALIEQQAAEEALANKEYLTNLDRVGRQQLMTQGIIDNEKFTRAQLGASTDILKEALGEQWITGTQKIDYNTAQRQLEAYWENRLGERVTSAQQYAQQTKALGNLIEGGADLYAAYNKKAPKEK